MYSDLYDKLINPPLHSGNITYRVLNEQEQKEIAAFYQVNSQRDTLARFAISYERLKYILKKYDIPHHGHHKVKPKPDLTEKVKSEAEKLVGKTVDYQAKNRTFLSFEVDETHLHINTLVHATPDYERRLKPIPLKEALKELKHGFILVK